MLAGIFENKLNGNYFWLDDLDEDEMKEAKYFVNLDNFIGVHSNIKSALYDDMTDYIDGLQREEDLADGELYVVIYFKFVNGGGFGLNQGVDFSITKQEIIDNVKNQKYVEGAYYYTMGQMFYTTKEVMEGKYND